MDERDLARKGKPAGRKQRHRESAVGPVGEQKQMRKEEEESGWENEEAQKGKVVKGERSVLERGGLKGHGFFFLCPVILEDEGPP